MRPASNVEWERWGETDPFFGVATWAGHERAGATPWTPEGFYALGQSDWEDFRRHWADYGLALGRCVEVGCGAGRMTRAMAADFGEVIGVDVSDGMLRVAREHIDRANVEMRLGDGITLPVDTTDAVFSTHVFQHFESLDVASANFAEIARILVPGGTMMIHMPVYWPPQGLPGIGLAMRIRKAVGNGRARLQRGRGQLLMRRLQYPWPWVRQELERLGFVDIELAAFTTRSNGDYQMCVLARRSSSARDRD